MNTKDSSAMAERIRAQYAEREHTALDELRALDAEVKRLPRVLAFTTGGIGSLVMGTGMSLVMTEIGLILPGILIGVAGMLAVLAAYPLYKAIFSSQKKKYGTRILALTETIIHE